MAFRSIPLVGIPPKKRWRWTYRGLTTVSASKCVAFLLFLLFFALAFRLRQRDLEFLIEPDFNWQLIEAWKDYLSTLNPNRLPLPYTDGYLDGQFILYAIADATIR
jgi:hypothetical protein